MNPMWPSRILRRAFQRLARRVPYVLCVIVCLTVTSAVHAADAGRAKRVLMVHSFGSSAPPFTTHSTAFETTLTQEMGNRVDLDGSIVAGQCALRPAGHGRTVRRVPAQAPSEMAAGPGGADRVPRRPLRR